MPERSSGAASPQTRSGGIRPPSNRVVLANAVFKALAAGLAFIMQIVLVKLLGDEDYGAYVLFITYCTVLTIFAKGGLPLIILRHFATKWSVGDTDGLRSVRTRSLLLVVVYSLATVALAQLLQLIPGLQFRFTGVVAVVWLFAAVFTAALLPVISGMLRGLHRVLLTEGLESIARPLLLLLIAFVGASALSIDGFSAGLTAFIGSNILVCAGILVLVDRTMARRAASSDDSDAGTSGGGGRSPGAAASVRPSSPFAVRPALVLIACGLLSYGLFQLDTLLVGLYLGEQAVAGYAMACNFVRIVTFAGLIISAQSQPLLAAAYGSGRSSAVRRITLVGLRNSVAAALVGAVILVVFGRPLLRLVSESFADAYSAMVVLTVAHLANTMVIILSAMLVMCRREAVVMRAQLVGLCICIPLLFVLIPRSGRLGAAVAVLAGLVIVMAILITGAVQFFRRQSPDGPDTDLPQ